MARLTVSKVAERTGTSPDTLRYYERIGLVAPAERSPAGYRLYDEQAIEQVRFVKRAQKFGLRLDEIGELLGIRSQGLCPCGRTRRLLEAKVAELDEELAALTNLRNEISRMLAEDQPRGGSCQGSFIPLGETRNGHDRREAR